MSLYNMLFGVNPFSGVLLEMLGTAPAKIPRYRDCFLDDDGDIVIHTRTGGGNRQYYDGPNIDNMDGPWNMNLRALPGFKFDADDSFDPTYADFHFAVPDAFKPQIALLKDLGAVGNPAERWKELLDGLQRGEKTPETQRALAVGEQIFARINEAIKKGGGDAAGVPS